MKRNSKRLVAVLLSAGLCAGALSGCGAESTTTAEAGTEAQPETEQEVTRTTEEPAEAEEEWSDVFVEPVAGISDDFIRGMDASAVLSVEKSGAKYYGYDGKEQDVFETLAESGVNYIRLRVWNDPYDENGNGYGGGDNDVATAIELGKRATQYGMKVNIDFHYSDFWADPKRQHAPKAWEGMSADEKADALYDFTKESLTQILDAGVDVGMVQVGNEINNGMSGETDVPAVMGLLSAGSRAVREIADSYGKDIQIVLHYTNIEDNEEVDTMAANLKEYGVDYDIFGLSYYPFWDGTNENMQNVAKNIMDRYGKKVVIAETSYCYTEKDGDGFGNSFDGIEDAVDGYAPTVQSQATMIRDICAAANEVGVLGVFYWEGTWIPVGSADQDDSALWEKYGSGWASSYSAEYDPDDAGLYYGGCSWDNQAMFDFTGHPLPSLNVFRYLKDGHTVPLAVDFIPQTTVSCDVGEALTLPETVEVVYNDRSANTQVPVSWDASQAAAIDTQKAGTYTVDGTLSDGTAVTADVDVEMVNYVKNPGFEEADRSMWQISYAGENDPTDYQEKADDAHDGDFSLHFWSDSDMDFSICQTLTDLPAGTYQLFAFAQGGDMESTSDLELYAVINGEEIGSDAFMLTTWTDWKQPKVDNIRIGDGDTLTIGVRMKCNANSWGTIDDFTLNRISD
ncbi:MAG: glycosyl hydrolase 53 family protein [Lachnospiraceae bacterium]|nr:glycosyl hydrolase 53 family protein [Lachnospiraceae bacterium]